MMVVARLVPGVERHGLATLLMKKSALTDTEIRTIENAAGQMGFTVFYSPLTSSDGDIAELVGARDLSSLYAAYPVDISPPTDDRPFFFNTARLRDLIARPSVLSALLLVVMMLTVATVLAPLLLFARRQGETSSGSGRLVLYFVSIGLAFMLLEMPLMQRFMLLLGHPTYALAVVLFSILLFSSLGSYSTQGLAGPSTRRRLRLALTGMLVLGAIHLLALPRLVPRLVGLPLALRILCTVLLVGPLGLLMGMPFPLGMAVAREQNVGMIPWLWAANGSASVLSSVLAVALATTEGFSVAMAVGLLAYLTALLVQSRFVRLPTLADRRPS